MSQTGAGQRTHKGGKVKGQLLALVSMLKKGPRIMGKRRIFIHSVLWHCLNVTAPLCSTGASSTIFLAQFQTKRAESNCIWYAQKYFSFAFDGILLLFTNNRQFINNWNLAGSSEWLGLSHSWIMDKVRASHFSHEGHLKSSVILT